MKNILSILLFVLSINIVAYADNNDNDKDIIIENNEVKAKGKLVGTIKLEEKEVDSKVKNFVVSVYNKRNVLVAVYDVKTNVKQKKSSRAIIEASLKTRKDNVTHTGSNFLNFNESENKTNVDEVPQFSKVVKYLIAHKYM